MSNKTFASLRRAAVLCLLSSALCLVPSGCTLLGVFAGKVLPAPTIEPKYTGLLNQSVAVMVWAGEGPLIDFPDIRTDVAGGLQNKLKQGQQAKTKSLQGITFPKSPTAIVRFQESNPQFEALPITEVAPKLGVGRVIYVEIEDLRTRSDASVELFRGSGSATLKVVEVPQDGGGPAKVVYEESGIAAVFPPNAREEGTPDGNDFMIYRGTADALTTEIAKRFVPHQEEQ